MTIINRIAKWGYDYALLHGPCDQSREIASSDPYFSLLYAREVDFGPHDVTRAGACAGACRTGYCYTYALQIDKSPRKDTYQACKGTSWAYYYDRNVLQRIP